jgi:hypothetical protein
MILFEEPFADSEKLTRDWVVASGMTIRHGVLAFCPGPAEGYCLGLTRRTDFLDFTITADVRIVSGAAGLVLRAVGAGQYYMVQFDLANDPSVVWFHTFTPSVEEGYRVELVPSAIVPLAGEWYRWQVTVRAATFDVRLSEQGKPFERCASWRDLNETYRQGAVGVWEHGGEAGEYRDLRVESIEELPAAER